MDKNKIFEATKDISIEEEKEARNFLISITKDKEIKGDMDHGQNI